MQYWLRIDIYVSERTVCKMSTLIRIVLRMLLQQCCSLATFPFDRFVSSFKSASISCSCSLSLGLSSSLPSLFLSFTFCCLVSSFLQIQSHYNVHFAADFSWFFTFWGQQHLGFLFPPKPHLWVDRFVWVWNQYLSHSFWVIYCSKPKNRGKTKKNP